MSELDFESLRDKLATGELTAIEQMTFDNLLHDRLAALAGAAPVAWMVEWPDEDDDEPIRIAFEYKRGAENRAAEVGPSARVFPLFTHAPAKAREDWQPIATAPKDDRSIMLHMPGQLRPLMIRGDDLASGFAHWAEGATHWRPIPEPPAALATFAEGE